MLGTVAEMIESGATHIGVATDHVIESFRNTLWPQYKTSDGIEPVLHAQFFPLEEALAAMGVVVWPMVELEADDALASAAQGQPRRNESRRRVSGPRIRISPNVWLTSAWCKWIAEAARFAMREASTPNIGVTPAHIPDYLALVGDSADGYPGIAGYGPKTAARLINSYGRIEQFPLRDPQG